MDALELLREDHQHLLTMLERLELAPTVADGTDRKVLAARKALVIDVVIAESQHEAEEEEYFWPMVRDGVPDGDRLADHAIDQERAAKYLLAALEETRTVTGLAAGFLPKEGRSIPCTGTTKTNHNRGEYR